MGKLSGKIALVTGGATGIGLATAKRFVEEGAFVYITGRRQEQLDKAVKTIGGNVVAVQGDVSNSADLDRLFATIKEEKGHLDIVFANAGVAVMGPVGTYTEEQFYHHFDINVKGVIFTVQKALALIPNGGRILLNGSVYSVKGAPGTGLYNATKAALRSFVRTWTSELKDRGIRVNVISPGPVATPGMTKMIGDAEAEKHVKAYLTTLVPLNRFAEDEEIAKAAVFLVCDDSSYVAGAELFVDGGLTAV